MLPPPRTIPKGKNSLLCPGTFPPAQSSCHHLQVCPCHLLSLLPAVPPPCSAHSSALLLLIKKIINPSSLMALWHWGLHKKAQEEQGTSVSPLLVALPPPFPPSQSLCRNLGARQSQGGKAGAEGWAWDGTNLKMGISGFLGNVLGAGSITWCPAGSSQGCSRHGWGRGRSLLPPESILRVGKPQFPTSRGEQAGNCHLQLLPPHCHTPGKGLSSG